MTLLAVEPVAGPWRVTTVDELAGIVLAGAGSLTGRPAVVAVDGRSAGGKTTLARRLSSAVPASAVVHTDDFAWQHSFFAWDELLTRGVLEPVRLGHAVHYRPPAWETHGRPGAIEVPAGLDLVVVEGVGAARRELADLLDAVVWVQSDFAEAERRGIARDLALGGHGGPEQTAAFWQEWMAHEVPFLERERPWERARVVVAGTPPLPHDSAEVVLAPGRHKRWAAAPEPLKGGVGVTRQGNETSGDVENAWPASTSPVKGATGAPSHSRRRRSDEVRHLDPRQPGPLGAPDIDSYRRGAGAAAGTACRDGPPVRCPLGGDFRLG